MENYADFKKGWNNPLFSDHTLILVDIVEEIEVRSPHLAKRRKMNREADPPLANEFMLSSSISVSGTSEELRNKSEEFDIRVVEEEGWKPGENAEQVCEDEAYAPASCPDEPVIVNSLILSANSPYFEKLFTNGMLESTLKKIRIEVPKDDRDLFKDLIRFLYTREFETKGVNLIRIIILADQYQIMSAVQEASKILGDSLNIDSVCEVVDFLAQLPNNQAFSTIVTSCRKFLYNEFSNFDKQDIQHTFVEKVNSHRAAAIVLTNSEMTVSSENTVFQVVKQWLKFTPERMTHAPYLVPFIRYYLMSPDFLRYVVLPSEIFSCFNSQQLVKVKDLLAQAVHYSMCRPEQKKALYSIQDGIRKRLMHPRTNSHNEPYSHHVDAPINISEPFTTEDFFVHGYFMNVRFEKVQNRDVEQLSVQLNLNHEATGINVAQNLTTMKVDIFFKDPVTSSWVEIHSVEKCWIKNASGKETRIRLPNQYIVGSVLPMRIVISPFIPAQTTRTSELKPRAVIG